MKKELKIFSALFIFVISFLIFNNIEFELLNEGLNNNVQSFIFSVTLTLSIFYKKSRGKLIAGSFLVISAMAGLFLLDKLPLANSLGSIGIGMLILILFSYIPELIKKGYAQNL